MPEDRITSALRGPAPVSQADGFAANANSGDDQGSGTAQSGYATPDQGPFECENCIHFEPPSQCNNQQVISDPEVQGQVEAQGCCNLFKSAGNESQQEEHQEDTQDIQEGNEHQ